MPTIKTILAPIDFSDSSAVAAQHAVALAMHFGSRVVFAHVIDAGPAEFRALTLGQAFTEAADIHGIMQEKLDAFARETAEGVPYEAVVVEGDPAHRLEVLAKEKGVDFAVMATRGYGAFRRFLVGSTTAKLIHDLKCPVLTGVHLADRPPFRPGPYKTVVCALGLQELAHSEQVLRWAADFAKEWDAKLHIAHVPPAIEWGAAEWFPPDTHELIRAASRERLAKLIAEVGCAAELHVDGLDPISYVNEVIERTNADVLVAGRSVGHGALGGLRTNAYAMIREALCPVISV
jgi:nucleotide-binding universal stress UspA family protein